MRTLKRSNLVTVNQFASVYFNLVQPLNKFKTMKNKDFIIAILLVIGFYVGTFYMWVNHKHIAQMFFFGLFILAFGTLAVCSFVSMKNLFRN